MYRKLPFLFMMVIMVGLMTTPVGKANAQVETQVSAPDCPPFDPPPSQDQKFSQPLRPECVEARRILLQNTGSRANVKDTLSVANDAGSIARSEVSRLGPPYLLYLPLVTNNFMSGISGRVTYQGNPISGITIELGLCNSDNSSCSLISTTTTQSGGYYQFTSAPSLGSGLHYAVDYWNSTNAAYVNYCGGIDLNSYTAGNAAAGGSFDIANIPQVSPPNGGNVALPYTFQWTPRVGVPSDIYLFEYWNSGFWWASPPLGYVSQYTLNSLASGSSLGATYYWDVAVRSPDGSICWSFDQHRAVTFH
jgi:hypothetical protein